MDESWAECINIFLNVSTAIIESILRISHVVIVWIYFKQPRDGLYILSVLLSSLTSLISFCMLIYILISLIAVIQQSRRQCYYTAI
jgi:hypothetical protein